MKKLLIVLVFGLSVRPAVYAQQNNRITLDSCYKLAVANNPLAKQQDLYSEASQLQESSLSANYLPQLSLGAQASWQSEVTALPITIPNVTIPSLDKDSYKISLDINQMIWDGGATAKQKELEKASLLLNQQSVETSDYRLKETINQVYFSILLLRENENLLKVSMSEIQSKLGRVRSGVANGMLLQSNADILDAEIIRIEQSLTELAHNRAAAIGKLSELTGIPLDADTGLEQPRFDSIPEANTRLRPEYHALELQQNKLSIQQKMTGLKVMPRISAFGTLGYGKPGLNMLSNRFDSFAMLGARFSWNVWDWNQHKNERRIIGIQNDVIETEKSNFERNQRILLNNLRQEILKNESLIAADHRIVSLRESVEKASGSQLEQGTITASDYLTEENAKTQARINLSLHTIQLQYARLNYITAVGLLK